jgi:DNA modification methylase
VQTSHQLHIGDARALSAVADGSIQLVVTSPPYPMVSMWDQAFNAMDPAVGDALAADDGWRAFESMHAQLDHVWAELFRVVSPGGFVCLNIGDATRSVGGQFALYPNHARMVMAMVAAGFTPLPDVLWRKPTNAPNKFMGSGMLPAGAYVTYEHEYILVFRRGGKRVFRSTAQRALRAQSAYFWEERNVWFSDIWSGVRGVSQRLDRGRARSGAFPIQVPYRLVNMYSAYGDTVLDPFAGTGTTSAAAVLAGRSSVAVELDPTLGPLLRESVRGAVAQGDHLAAQRLRAHVEFVRDRLAQGKRLKHRNAPHDVPVITQQERTLALWSPVRIASETSETICVEHAGPTPG